MKKNMARVLLHSSCPLCVAAPAFVHLALMDGRELAMKSMANVCVHLFMDIIFMFSNNFHVILII